MRRHLNIVLENESAQNHKLYSSLSFCCCIWRIKSNLNSLMQKNFVDLFPCPLTALITVIIVANISFKQGIKLLLVYLLMQQQNQIHPPIYHPSRSGTFSPLKHHPHLWHRESRDSIQTFASITPQTFIFAPAFTVPYVCIEVHD